MPRERKNLLLVVSIIAIFQFLLSWMILFGPMLPSFFLHKQKQNTLEMISREFLDQAKGETHTITKKSYKHDHVERIRHAHDFYEIQATRLFLQCYVDDTNNTVRWTFIDPSFRLLVSYEYHLDAVPSDLSLQNANHNRRFKKISEHWILYHDL